MPLPAPVVRRLKHTRRVTYEGYERDDGLWDIEAELHDSKPFAFQIPGEAVKAPGEAVHHMRIRLTVNTQLVIQAVDVVMDSHPHGPCPDAMPPMQGLVGATLGRGWRKTIDTHLAGVIGCTHLRELLFNMATAAFQSMTSVFVQKDDHTPPPHLGQCRAWDFGGPVVQKVYPMFFRPRQVG